MAFIVPKFRRDSWYGRLYRHAYGADRGWLVRLKLAGSIGFDYAPCPEFPADASEAERIGARVDWRRRADENYARSLAFLHLPPSVQPFVEDGPKVSICPTFWKIVFAMLVYCPIFAIRAIGHAIVGALRATFTAIATAFRWTGRRFGRPLAWAGASAFVCAGSAAFIWWVGTMSYFVTGQLMPRQGISTLDALAQEEAAKRIVEREELRQEYLRECARTIQCDVEYAANRSWQPDLDCSSSCDTPPRISHEEYARRCVGHDELRLAAIEAVEQGDLDCARSSWEFGRLFPTDAERKALAMQIASGLRTQFADELGKETLARERRIAEARKRDLEVVGVVTVELLPLVQDPRSLYERFHQMCDDSYNGTTWFAQSRSIDGMTNATCATLAGLFGDQIDDAKSAIRWQGLKETTRAGAPLAAKIGGVMLGVILLLGLLIFALERYGQPLLRGIEWFFERVLGPGLKWLAIIVFAPIWAPALYLVWPALKAMGRAWLLVWNFGPVAFVRHAFASVFTGIGAGIRWFFVAVWQIAVDTWHLIRAFASARWHQLCPFIEWTP